MSHTGLLVRCVCVKLWLLWCHCGVVRVVLEPFVGVMTIELSRRMYRTSGVFCISGSQQNSLARPIALSTSWLVLQLSAAEGS